MKAYFFHFLYLQSDLADTVCLKYTLDVDAREINEAFTSTIGISAVLVVQQGGC